MNGGTFADIDRQITALEGRIAELRAEGARVAAGERMSGAEMLTWLKRHGATDMAARMLCVEIIRERRAVADKAEEQQP